MLFLTVLPLLLTSFNLLADEGALPRGKDSGPGIKYKISATEDPDGNCFSYLLNPDQGFISFNPFSKKAFFIGKEREQGKTTRSFVLELSLDERTIKKRISLKVKDTASIIAHREPTEAVTILDFRKGSFACGQGASAGIGVRWGGKQGVIKTFDKKRYKILRSTTGQELLDRSDNAVRVFDLSNLQKRTIASLPKQGIPLFLDMNASESIHFEPTGFGTLLRYNLKKMKKTGELRLAKDMKLIQQSNRFAVAKIDAIGKKITVNLVKGWSGKSNKKLVFPSSFQPLEQARLSFDFDYGIGIISGRHQEIARDWRHAEIIDGNMGKVIRQIKAPPGEYIAHIEPFPYSHWAIVITKSTKDDSFGTISLYNLRDDKVEQIHLK